MLTMQPSTRSTWARWIPYCLMVSDILALLLAFYLARISHALRSNMNPIAVLTHWWGDSVHISLLLLTALVIFAVGLFTFKGHYNQRKAFWDEIGEIIWVLTVLTILNAAIAFSGNWAISRLWIFTNWILALLSLPGLRALCRKTLRWMGIWERPVAIIGCGENAHDVMQMIHQETTLGYTLQAILLPDASRVADSLLSLPVPTQALGDDYFSTLSRLGNPHVILALEPEQWALQEQLLRSMGNRYPNLSISPPLRDLPLFGLETIHFFGHEVLMLRINDNLARIGPRIIKRAFDLIVASSLLLLLAPFMLSIAWRIKRADGGSALYAQERIGFRGRPFQCLKFRSMIVDADKKLIEYLELHPELKAEYEINFKLKNDPRITSIGNFLRKTSLDELPQLFNVIRGDMSLVGPRPVTEKELDEYYKESAQIYKRVHPGITGLWQISGRSETTYARRIDLDSWYIRNWSLWHDIVILLRTVKVVLQNKGAY